MISSSAAFLDPRTKKLDGLTYAQKDRAKDLVRTLYEEAKGNTPTTPTQPGPSPTSYAPQKRKLADILYRPSSTSTSNDKLHIYFKMSQEIDDKVNAFQWWWKRKEQFPVLHKVALHILSIPASSAVVERAFSQARTVVHEQQSLTKKKATTKCFIKLNYHLIPKNFLSQHEDIFK
jgi:hypothetical protein